MEALKKTGVAAMIMVVCIALAIVIGDSRKSSFTNPDLPATETEITESEENNAWDFVTGMTTYGKVREEIEEGRKEAAQSSLYDDETSQEDVWNVKRVALIVIGAFVIFSIFGKRR